MSGDTENSNSVINRLQIAPTLLMLSLDVARDCTFSAVAVKQDCWPQFCIRCKSCQDSLLIHDVALSIEFHAARPNLGIPCGLGSLAFPKMA